MTIKEKENILFHINEAQQQIVRYEKTLDRLYKEENPNFNKIDRIEGLQIELCHFRDGLKCALTCNGMNVDKHGNEYMIY